MPCKQIFDFTNTTNTHSELPSPSPETPISVRRLSDPKALDKRLSMSGEWMPRMVPSSPPAAESASMPRMCATREPPADLRADTALHAARQGTSTQNASFNGNWFGATQTMLIGGPSQGMGGTSPRDNDYLFHRGQLQGPQGRPSQPPPSQHTGDLALPDFRPPSYDQAGGSPSPSLASRPQPFISFQRTSCNYPTEQHVGSHRIMQNRGDESTVKNRQTSRTSSTNTNAPELMTLARRTSQVQSVREQISQPNNDVSSSSSGQFLQSHAPANGKTSPYPQQSLGATQQGVHRVCLDASFQSVGQERYPSGQAPQNGAVSVGYPQAMQGGGYLRPSGMNTGTFGERTVYSLAEPDTFVRSSQSSQASLHDTQPQSMPGIDGKNSLRPVPASLGVNVKHRRSDMRGSPAMHPPQSRTQITNIRSQPPVLPVTATTPNPHYVTAEASLVELEGGQQGSSGSMDFARIRTQIPELAVCPQGRQSTKIRTPLSAVLPRLEGSHIESPLETSQRRCGPPRGYLASPVSVPGATTSCSSTSSSSPYLANTEGTQPALSHQNSSLVGCSTEFHPNARSAAPNGGVNTVAHHVIDVDGTGVPTYTTPQDHSDATQRAHHDRSRQGGKKTRKNNEAPSNHTSVAGDECSPSVRSNGNESSHNSYSNISNPQSNSLSPAVGRSSRNGKRCEPTANGGIFDAASGTIPHAHPGTHLRNQRGNEQVEPLDVSSMQRDNSVNFCGIPTRREDEEYRSEDSPGSNTRPSLVNTSMSFQLNVALSGSSGSTMMSGIAPMDRHNGIQSLPTPLILIPPPPHYPDEEGSGRRTTVYERHSNTVSCAPSTLSFEGDASALCLADSSSMTYSQSCERECSVQILTRGCTAMQLPTVARAFYSKGFDVTAHHAEREKVDQLCAKVLAQRPEVYSYPARAGVARQNEIMTRCVLIPSAQVARLTPTTQDMLSTHDANISHHESADHHHPSATSQSPLTTLLPPQGFCCTLHFIEYQNWKRSEDRLSPGPWPSSEEELLSDFKVFPPSSSPCADERSAIGSPDESPSATLPHSTTLTCCDHVRRVGMRKTDVRPENGDIRVRFAKNVGRPTLVLDLDETLVHTTDVRPNYWDPRKNRNHLELFLDPDSNVCHNRYPNTPWSHETYLRELQGSVCHASSTAENSPSCGVWDYLFQTVSNPAVSPSANPSSNANPFSCTCATCNPESPTYDAALTKFFSRRYLEREYRSVLLEMQKKAYAGQCPFADVTAQSKNLAYLESDVFPECLESLYVELRPGVLEFLSTVTDLYEVTFFTAGMRAYAEPVLDYLDHSHKAMFRLYQSECNPLFMWTAPKVVQPPSTESADTKKDVKSASWELPKYPPLTPPTIKHVSFDPDDATARSQECVHPPSRHVVKMLYRLNRPLDRVIIMDNSSVAYCMNRSNALPIEDFLGQEEDFMTATPPSSQSIVGQHTPIPPSPQAGGAPSDSFRAGNFPSPPLPSASLQGRQVDSRQSQTNTRSTVLPPRNQTTLPPPPHIARLRAHYTAYERERQGQDGHRERPKSNVVRGEDDCELADKLSFLKWLSNKPHPVLHLVYNQRQLLEEDTCF